jgi:polysaccharide transporter, PST family
MVTNPPSPLMRIWSKDRLSNLFSHTLVQNALSLYGVQIAGYILPLITIPYLARVLGVAGWGLVAFAQAFGSFAVLAAEYGFALSATREVARHREDREKVAGIFAGVLGAKGLIAAASLLLAVLIRPWVPILSEHPALLWAGMFWALSQALNVMWFFQGYERLRLVAALDISAKALATGAIFVLVKRPGDGWLVLATQGCGFLVSFAVGLGLAYRELPFRFPTWSSVWEALRMGWTMFLFRASVSLYSVGNAFILGLFVSPQLVGYFAGAEKISKAFLGLFTPISQTLYPRQSYLLHHDRDRAARLARVAAIIMVAGGAAVGALVFVLAPLLVQVILGKAFVPAVPVLRVLSLLLPLIGMNTAVGTQWMLPLGLDRTFTTTILLAGLINLVLASVLASSYAGLGMACAIVSAEIYIGVSFCVILRRRKLHPMSYQAGPQAESAQADL